MTKKRWIWILVAIIFGGFMGVFTFKVVESKKPDTNESSTSTNVLDDLKDKINTLNSYFKKENLTDVKYTSKGNINCYKYIKDDQDVVRSLIEELYDEDNFYFPINIEKEDKEKESLYICYSSNCKFDNIEIIEVDDKQDRKIDLMFNEKVKYSMFRINNEWKFTAPIMFCE